MAKPRSRGAGEGTVYQRQDNRWTGAITVGWKTTGQPDRRYVYAKTRREAAEKLQRVQAEAARGGGAAPNRQTLAQFAVRYERDVLGGLSRNTQSNVHMALQHHLLPAFGARPLQALRPAAIQAWLAGHGGAPSSLRLYRNVLHRILAQAVAWGELARNPVDAVRGPRLLGVAPRFLERAEAQRVLAGLAGDSWEALAWLALTAGLRQGELLALQWGDLDRQQRRLAVQRNYTRGEVKAVKTGASRRSVPLSPEAYAALLRREQDWPSVPWVFTTASGGLIAPSRIGVWWREALRRAGVRHAVFHSARHAAGSYLLDLGMPLPQVSRLLGHSSVAVTAKTYAHALSVGEEQYVERLGGLLASKWD